MHAGESGQPSRGEMLTAPGLNLFRASHALLRNAGESWLRCNALQAIDFLEASLLPCVLTPCRSARRQGSAVLPAVLGNSCVSLWRRGLSSRW
jgi:hypothetical protein